MADSKIIHNTNYGCAQIGRKIITQINQNENIQNDEIKNNETRRNKYRYVTTKRKYMKDATFKIEDINIKEVDALDVINTIENLCGVNTVLAVIPDKEKNNSYEITMDTVDNACKLIGGLKINDHEYTCSMPHSKIIVVSFLHIPSYVEDEELLCKLRDKNIEILSRVFRRAYPSTQVADGTRYVRVKFPEGLVSLAWSMAFDTSEGRRYFKVVHDKQIKVCTECQSPDHVFKNCPDFVCNGCGAQGHKAKNCTAPRCERCHKLPRKCECKPEVHKKQTITEDEYYTRRDIDDMSFNDDDEYYDFDDLPDYSPFTGCKWCRRLECICVCKSCNQWYDDCICETFSESVDEKEEEFMTDEDNHLENENVKPKGSNENMEFAKDKGKHSTETSERVDDIDNLKKSNEMNEKQDHGTRADEVKKSSVGVVIDSDGTLQNIENGVCSTARDNTVTSGGLYNETVGSRSDDQDNTLECYRTVCVKDDMSGGDKEQTSVCFQETEIDGRKRKNMISGGGKVKTRRPSLRPVPNLNAVGVRSVVSPYSKD